MAASRTLISWKQQHLHAPMGQRNGRSIVNITGALASGPLWTLIVRGRWFLQTRRMQKFVSSMA